jgi:hypothetical protein
MLPQESVEAFDDLRGAQLGAAGTGGREKGLFHC